MIRTADLVVIGISISMWVFRDEIANAILALWSLA